MNLEKSLKIWNYFHIKWWLWKFFFWFTYSGNWKCCWVSSVWCSEGSLWTVWLSRWRLYHLLKLQGTTCPRIHCHVLEDLIFSNTAMRTSYVAEIFSDCILDEETFTNMISLLGSLVPYKNQSCYIRFMHWMHDTRQLRIYKLSHRLAES